MAKLRYAPSKNGIQKTLASQLLSGVTASASLNNVDGIQNKSGVMVVDRIDANGTATPSKREYIGFAGTSGSTVVTLERNVDGGGTDQDHAAGAIVEFIPDIVWADAIQDALEVLVSPSDTTSINTTYIVTPTGTQTLANKTITGATISAANINLATLSTISFNISGATTGDLFYRNSAGLVERLAKGTTGYYLAANASLPAWSAPTIGTDGWSVVTETLTYASATTITIASGGASRWKKGDKLKITQTTDKYFYVIGVADTLLTVTGGSDYTVANAAITAASYSRSGTAIGFPDYFNITVASWATSGTAFTNAPTTPLFRMSIVENKCWLWAIFLTNATSGGTGIFKATITSNQIPNRVDNSLGNAMNVSSTSSTGVCYISNTNEISIQKYDATAIAGNNAYFDLSMWYMF